MSTVPLISVRALQLDPTLPNYYEPIYGGNAFVYDLQAVAQICLTSLRFLSGEAWYATQIGFPLFNEILGQPATSQNQELFANLIQQTLLAVPYVTSISNVVTGFVTGTRQYTYSCTVSTQFGQFVISNAQNYPKPFNATIYAG